jgi:hypothetical protein
MTEFSLRILVGFLFRQIHCPRKGSTCGRAAERSHLGVTTEGQLLGTPISCWIVNSWALLSAVELSTPGHSYQLLNCQLTHRKVNFLLVENVPDLE